MKPVIAVKDLAVNAFNTPTVVPSVGYGLRAFMDEANNRDSQINKHPKDYELWLLANYDEDTGTFHTVPGEHSQLPARIARASDLVKEN